LPFNSLTAGTRTSIGFSINSDDFYSNISEKARDLKMLIENYNPESPEIDREEFLKLYSENPDENKIHIKRYKDAIFIGETNENNKRHGKGIMIYENGRKYEGNWINDLREGRGYEKHSNGNMYMGEFSNGKAHGHGVYKWTNGE
jgi:hypothetical protein